MSNWTSAIPASRGIYMVRGWLLNDERAAAVAVVDHNAAGALVCNLHRECSELDREEWWPLADLSTRFSWRQISDEVPQHMERRDD